MCPWPSGRGINTLSESWMKGGIDSRPSCGAEVFIERVAIVVHCTVSSGQRGVTSEY